VENKVYRLLEEVMGIGNDIKKVAVQALIPFAIDMVVDIVRDMITPEGVVAFRDRVIAMAREMADKTTTEVDDVLVEKLVANVLTVENYDAYGRSLIAWATQYVQNTETKYDDYLVPILQGIEAAFSTKE
jgi:hypothetical protein